MIIHCTWTQYGITAGACCLLYYLLVLGCYYRQEITVFFHREKGLPTSRTKTALPVVFGPVRSDDTEMAVISADELAFADNDGRDEFLREPMPDKVFLLGGLADFQQELKTLVRITIESQDTKENFLDLLQLVASGYPPLADQQYIGPITAMLLENSGDFPFELRESDIQEALINTSFND